MTAEIVSVGTELLLGNIVNTNAAHIARALAVFGVDVYYHTTAGDNLARATATIRTALERSDAVIVTGGIGPTPDDCTRDAIAGALGVGVEQRAELVAQIDERYARRGRTPNAAAYKQALIPVGAEAMVNPVGTAPGILATRDGKAIYAMPGVPFEMERMLDETVLPDLRARFGLTTGLFARVLRTRGIGESDLAQHLADLLESATNPTVATYVKTGEVEIRLTARATDAAAAQRLFEAPEWEIRARVGSFIHATDDERDEERLGERLTSAGWRLVTAESCTGGWLGEQITRVPGSSGWYLGGVVAYSNALKERLLGVDPAILAGPGAVSAECAAAMARGAVERLGGECGVSITGIAGPDGGSGEKPVGLVYLGWYDVEGHGEVTEHRFPGGRAGVRERAVLAALETACRQLTRSKR